MPDLGTAQLGIFYAREQRNAAALEQYGAALPAAVLEAHRKGGSGDARRQLAETYLRLGALEARDEKFDRDVFKSAQHHFESATMIAPEYPLAYATFAVFLLRGAQDLYLQRDIPLAQAHEYYSLSVKAYKAALSFSDDAASELFGSTYNETYKAPLLAGLADSEICSSLSNTISSAGQLRSAALNVTKARNELSVTQTTAGARLYDTVEATSTYLSILMRNGSCRVDLQKCLEEADKQTPKSERSHHIIESSLLATLRECSDVHLALDILEHQFSYHSHVALALYQMDSMRLFYFEHRYVGVQAALKGLSAAVEQARQRAEADLSAAKVLSDGESLTKAEQEPAEQRDLNTKSLVAQGGTTWDYACHDHPKNLESLLTEASHALYIATTDAPGDGYAKSSYLQLSAMSPQATPGSLEILAKQAQAAVETEPRSYRLRLALASFLLRLERLEAADATLEVAAELSPENPLPYFLLGSIAYRQGHIAEAEDDWHLAHRLDPSGWQTLAQPAPGCVPSIGLA
jgi:hypothetical protein